MTSMARVRVIPLALVAVSLVGCASGHKRSASVAPAGSTSSGTGTATAPSSTTARCATSALAVWIGLGEGGSTAGSTFYPLELTNVSTHVCHLFGYPGVSAWRGHQLGSPAERDHAVPKHTVTLAPGETAHTVLRISDVGNFSRSRCAPATAFGLKVIPPDETTSKGVPFGFRACSKAGPVYLTVQPVQSGVGVPGYPGL
jgi:Protein of unknown function (DUF4232)